MVAVLAVTGPHPPGSSTPYWLAAGASRTSFRGDGWSVHIAYHPEWPHALCDVLTPGMELFSFELSMPQDRGMCRLGEYLAHAVAGVIRTSPEAFGRPGPPT